MTKVPASSKVQESPRRRIRPLLLVLLWAWAICIFIVIDLFLNVNEFDSIRPRADIYRYTREAAHDLIGEPLANSSDVAPIAGRQDFALAEEGPGRAFIRGPGMHWGPRGMVGGAPSSNSRTAPDSTAGEKTTASTEKPAYRASPRTITPRVVNLKSNRAQTGHGSWTQWNEPEGDATEGELVDRRRDGKWVWTWANGKPREERNYRNGTMNGFVRAWYADGKPQIEEQYRDGKPTGRWRAWYGGGQLAWEENYIEGVKHGEVTWFHNNGKPSLTGRYESGKPVDEWVHSDARGQVVERRTFE